MSTQRAKPHPPCLLPGQDPFEGSAEGAALCSRKRPRGAARKDPLLREISERALRCPGPVLPGRKWRNLSLLMAEPSSQLLQDQWEERQAVAPSTPANSHKSSRRSRKSRGCVKETWQQWWARETAAAQAQVKRESWSPPSRAAGEVVPCASVILLL